MNLREAIAKHFSTDPAGRARWETLQQQGLRAAQQRPSLFVDADAYQIPDIPVQVDGVILWAAGDIPLNDFLAVASGQMTELEVAVRLFGKHHPDIPVEILKENLGMVRTLKIIQDVMARISDARTETQGVGQAALEGAAPPQGGFSVGQCEEKASPVIPFAPHLVTGPGSP